MLTQPDAAAQQTASHGAVSSQGAATRLQVHERTLQGDFLMALLRELVVARRAAGRPLKVRLCRSPFAASALSRTACTACQYSHLRSCRRCGSGISVQQGGPGTYGVVACLPAPYQFRIRAASRGFRSCCLLAQIA